MTTGCNTRSVSESAPSPIGRITLGTKPAGERRTGNLYAPFERAGAGDGRFAYRASPRPYHSKAIGAVARQLAEATYWMVTKQEAYREPIASRPTRLGRSRGASAVSP